MEVRKTATGTRAIPTDLSFEVAHVVRKRPETVEEKVPVQIRQVVLRESAFHAPDPLIALALTNRKRQMPHPESGMAVAFSVQLRATRPAGEEEEEFLVGALQARGVKSPDPGRFGSSIHQLIEPVDEAVNARLAAEKFKM